MYILTALSHAGPYLPIWQVSPVIPGKNSLGYNVLSNKFFAKPYLALMNSQKANINKASNLNQENLESVGAYFRSLYSYSQYRYNVDAWLGDPTSTFSYPVFDSFNHETRKVVGIVASSAFWRNSIEGVLPENAKSVFCVFESTDGVSFTYVVNGANRAVYLGAGDLHDRRFTHMGLHESVRDYMESRTSPQTMSYTSVTIDFDYLDFKLSVYPSSEFESYYKTSAPMLSFVVILSIFAFTSLVFAFYDWFVRRRQRIVMERAIASGASK